MIIILPDDFNGLASLESKLTHSDFFAEINRLVRKEIDLFLPRFKVEESMDLVEILKRVTNIDLIYIQFLSYIYLLSF